MPAPTIDRALLANLEEMARLHVATDRLTLVCERLQRIVGAFEALRHLPIGDVEPAAADLPLPSPLRADRTGPVLTQEEVLANAPKAAAGCFLVPRVVDA